MKRVWRSCESKVVAHKQGWKCATCNEILPPSFELDTRTVAATNADKAAARARLADACEDILKSLRARDADARGFAREDVIAAVREKYEYDDAAETYAVVLGDATRFAKDAEAKKAKGR